MERGAPRTAARVSSSSNGRNSMNEPVPATYPQRTRHPSLRARTGATSLMPICLSAPSTISRFCSYRATWALSCERGRLRTIQK
eukprot:2239439-Pleurochrysis_carterae.AAC.1